MAQSLPHTQVGARPRLLERLLGAIFHYLRLVIGCVFIVIGILGVILPILPGTVWFVIASLIIGKRSRLLRRLSVSGKQMLRGWAGRDQRIVRWIGRWSVAAQRDTSRRLRRINFWFAAQQNNLRRRLLRA